MGLNLARKLIESHLLEGTMRPGGEIGIRVDQTLTQDATGTLVMLSLEAIGLDRVRTEVSAQYVDHNLIQQDSRNADDHLFLESACRRFGVWFSRPGNGVSHPVHMQHFGRPGKTLVGSDSHTCAGGAVGMLAMGAGGLEVAFAMAGEPFYLRMPRVWGIRLVGALPEWVSAKDVVLEMLRRHKVSGGLQRIVEYHGPGVAALDAWDRHVIANMGAELGATTSVFPSDERTRAFLRAAGRESEWVPLAADPDASYDDEDEIDLGRLEPLIAKPQSPDNVVRVRDVAGEPIYQAYLGSSANPAFRDLAVPACMVRGRKVADGVSFDVNPASRQVLLDLLATGRLEDLLRAGARLHQAGCNGCIGMGQAPASRRNSVRTVPRNFPGRSGTREDSVWLASPETATASALTGRITDPRDLGVPCPPVEEPAGARMSASELFLAPLDPAESAGVSLVKTPNIAALPVLDPLPPALRVPVILRVGDNVSTDEILPAGARVLPFRSNIPEISRFSFDAVDPTYSDRAKEVLGEGGHAVVAGCNYGQGSSREHAALAPRYLGLRMVLAKSFARIHRQNLVNFGVVPLELVNEADYDLLTPGVTLSLEKLPQCLIAGPLVPVTVDGKRDVLTRHDLSDRQLAVIVAGGLIRWLRARGI